jgi:uncharacterized protein
MRLFLDVNMLLYVVFNSYTEHEICRDWFEDAMDDTANRIGFPIAALLGFVRLSTQPRSSFLPITMAQALELVEGWVKQPNAYVPQPGDGHIEQVVNLMRSVNGNHALVTDAHLAALAIEHQATICSHDSDFKLFSALSVFDPLQ